MARIEYVVYRDNFDEPLGYGGSSKKAADDLVKELNEDEASYLGCSVADLEFPAYIRSENWDDN